MLKELSMTYVAMPQQMLDNDKCRCEYNANAKKYILSIRYSVLSVSCA